MPLAIQILGANIPQTGIADPSASLDSLKTAVIAILDLLESSNIMSTYVAPPVIDTSGVTWEDEGVTWEDEDVTWEDQ